MRSSIGLFYALLVLLNFPSAFAVDFGTPDRQEAWPDVVALARESGGQSEGVFQIFCSGVVVHPTVVLTAAHCLQRGGVRPSASQLRRLGRSIRVYFGPGQMGGEVSPDARLRQVRRAYLHPGYLRDIRGQADIAVVILDSPAPIAAERIRPIALDLDLIKNRMRRTRPLTVVGFGFSEQLSGSSGMTSEVFGIRHFGEVEMEGKTADEIMVVDGRPIDPSGFYRPAPREGDSGGPAFFRDQDGAYYLAGIVSRAVRHNHGPFGAAFSLVRNKICWIEAKAGFRLRPVIENEPDYCDIRPPHQIDSRVSGMSLLDQCRAPDRLPRSAAYTIHVLRKLLGEKSCESLNDRLNRTIHLNIDATYITDVSPLAAIPSLERLILRDNAIQSVASLEALPKLRVLDISYNNVRDAHELSRAKSGDLWVYGDQRQYWNIGRTRFIRQCSDPETAPSARRTIESLIALFGFRSGECVNANYELIRRRKLEIYRPKGLTDMTPLIGLKTLEELDLSGHALTDIEFLRGVDDLRTLVLDGNQVSDLSPLLAHPNLRELSIRNMNLEDISVLGGLRRLSLLKVHGNRIADFSSLTEKVNQGLKIEGSAQQRLH